MGSKRWTPTCLALWLTLCATHAAAQVPAPADTIPGPDASLAHVLEAGDLSGGRTVYWFPRARGELQEILASRLRLKAALRDTVSALNARAVDAAALAGAREDSLRDDLRWANLDLVHMQETRPRWYERPGVVVPVTMFLTLLLVDVTVGD